jgi:hypothetical protein
MLAQTRMQMRMRMLVGFHFYDGAACVLIAVDSFHSLQAAEESLSEGLEAAIAAEAF